VGTESTETVSLLPCDGEGEGTNAPREFHFSMHNFSLRLLICV
jgi:hypothetical protein